MARDQGGEVHIWVHDEERRFVDAASLPTSVAGASSRGGPATRTKVATYYGSSFHAERGPDGQLDVYFVGTMPLATQANEMTGDVAKGPMTAAKMQAISEASRRRVAGGR